MQTKAKRRSGWGAESQFLAIGEAIGHLRDARWLLRNAGSKRAADYVCRALKSAQGAQNHARRMANAEAWRNWSAEQVKAGYTIKAI